MRYPILPCDFIHARICNHLVLIICGLQHRNLVSHDHASRAVLHSTDRMGCTSVLGLGKALYTVSKTNCTLADLDAATKSFGGAILFNLHIASFGCIHIHGKAQTTAHTSPMLTWSSVQQYLHLGSRVFRLLLFGKSSAYSHFKSPNCARNWGYKTISPLSKKLLTNSSVMFLEAICIKKSSHRSFLIDKVTHLCSWHASKWTQYNVYQNVVLVNVIRTNCTLR